MKHQNCSGSVSIDDNLTSQTIQLKLRNLESEDKIQIILNNELPHVASEKMKDKGTMLERTTAKESGDRKSTGG